MSDLMLMVDGGPVPLSDVVWEGVGSCGCPFAWTVAESHGKVYASTPEQAKATLFGESAVSLKFYESSGASVRPILRAEIPRPDKCCTHAPRFGLPDAEPPEGHEWATTDGHWGRKSHKRHIVPTLPLGDEGWRGRLYAESICGARAPRGRRWESDRTDRFADVRGKVPCSKCIKATTR